MSNINSILSMGSSARSLNQLNANTRSMGKSFERLATGNAINRASDSPSGLVASEHMLGKLSSIQAEITSIDRRSSSLNIQDGRLSATLSNVGELDSLVVQGANAGGLSSGELGAIQTQVEGVLTGIGRSSSEAGMNILSSVTTDMVVGTDEVTGDPITETVSLSDLSRVMETDPEAAQRLVDGARDVVVTAQAEAGIEARAADSERRVLQEEQINIARANSQVRDTDYAAEGSKLVRSEILTQASIYTILAERQSAESVLGLLADVFV